MDDHDPPKRIRLGEFPFPISDGAEESRYLLWIRNHSNYMAVRGLLDYVRAVAVLARGALINAIVGLPLLMLIAIGVALYYVGPSRPGFHVTPWVLGAAAGLVVLVYPFAVSLMKISNFHRSMVSGTDSSVKLRDRRERRFGALLILIVAVAAFEALAVFLDIFHVWVHETQFSWAQVASIAGAVVAAYGLVDKLLSTLGGMAKKVAIVAIGTLGLLVPVAIVLYIADYLVFSRPRGDDLAVAMVATFLLTLAVLLVLMVGAVRRAFSWKDGLRVLVLWLMSAALFIVVLEVDDRYQEWTTQAEIALDQNSAGLASGDERYKKEVDALRQRAVNEPGPALKALEASIDAYPLWPAPAVEVDAGDGQPEAPQKPYAQLEADLPEVHALLVAVDQALEQGTWPPPPSRLGKAGGERVAIAPAQAQALLQERSYLQLPVDYTYHLRSAPTQAERVEFVLRARSELMELVSLDDEGRPVHVGLLSTHFTDQFDKAKDELFFWDNLAYDARLEVASAATPRSFPKISALIAEYRWAALWPKITLVLVVATLLALFCWYTVDINLTSIHGLYRDRLATAFLIGANTRGDVDIEEDLDLGDLSRHEAGSIAPYHLINVALNLQGSRDIGVRDRRSDFFIFSKRFIGGRRTGYCRSETMERAFPQMSLSTAMAISAAAASPNMGSATSPALVALMTLLNVRLGIWVPNPGRLQLALAPHTRDPADADGLAPGYAFAEVFREELIEVQQRWAQLGDTGDGRVLADSSRPSVGHRLVGIGFSGGGIRSATINLGIAQALHRRGMFDHIDFMSTVSGGGYLGSSLSALMRQRIPTESEVAGRVRLATEAPGGQLRIAIAPDVQAGGGLRGAWHSLRTRFARKKPEPARGAREYRYEAYAQPEVRDGDLIQPGQRLLKSGPMAGRGPGSFGGQFLWRVRPSALIREMLGRLDETGRWVNVSDGGHIENLACIELLRRRCKYIVIGDGEADPRHQFHGLATLMRQARIDLGIHIELDADALRLDEHQRSRNHWAVGRVHYPGESEPGHLLYLKSSITGDEDEIIREYRARCPSFPHESTADQMFNEGQFEAYRSLGQHIGEQALASLGTGRSFADLERWFDALATGAAVAAGDGSQRPASSAMPPAV